MTTKTNSNAFEKHKKVKFSRAMFIVLIDETERRSKSVFQCERSDGEFQKSKREQVFFSRIFNALPFFAKLFQIDLQRIDVHGYWPY